MYFSHSMRLGLALTGLVALCDIAARPAAAQQLTYTLTGVTFNDGATASGYFNFDPTTQTLGSFNIVTINGVTDGLMGGTYLPGQASGRESVYQQQSTFSFSYGLGTGSAHALGLVTTIPVSAGGHALYSLVPGVATATNQYVGSGEYVPLGSNTVMDRLITVGSLSVSNPAAVPEASTTVSFGLLLALGFGGVIIAAKKKKALA